MGESLLALDLALHAGIAAWIEGDAKPYASLLTIDSKKSIGGRLAQLNRYLLKICHERHVTDMCVEEPIVTGAPGDAQQRFWLISAYGIVLMVGAQLNIRVTPIANATMIIHWAGADVRAMGRKDRKTYSILEAQRRGFPNVQDDNIADALGLLSLRCATLKLNTPWDSKSSPGPLFSGAHAPAGIRISKQNKIAASVALNRALSFDRDKPT